jgi:hypothetical protein
MIQDENRENLPIVMWMAFHRSTLQTGPLERQSGLTISAAHPALCRFGIISSVAMDALALRNRVRPSVGACAKRERDSTRVLNTSHGIDLQSVPHHAAIEA